MSLETRKKRRGITAFGWLMIFLSFFLALGLAILIFGLLMPQPTYTL